MPELHTVAFIVFCEQDNLGVGYITSILLNTGYRVKMIDFRLGKDRILEELRRSEPLVVGFSIIFQYHIDEFRELITYLRLQGIHAHFCAGGHYPSLRPRQLMQLISELDSVVLFEGERTFLELAEALSSGQEWRHIRGIAHRDGQTMVINPLRPLEPDLDNFPPPFRPPLKEFALGKKYATLLAGRGCVYDCSFCSIREFYSRPPGSIKRLRRPEMVVREMELLRDDMDCSVFVFQDDDFPVSHPWGSAWASRFCQLVEEKELNDKILWKISCRPDEISGRMFEMMKSCGLFLVYLGIESGTEEGLCLMNKHIKPGVNIDGVRILKELGINYDYGFMLFDPSSTIDSVRQNLHFLETICGDGSSPVTLCKMRPYAETKIEAVLREQGRLKGRTGFEDYEFLDDRVNALYTLVTEWFANWIGAHDGILNFARWTRYHLAVFRKYFTKPTQAVELEERTAAITRESNGFILRTIGKACDILCSDRGQAQASSFSKEMEEEIRAVEEQYRDDLREVIREVEVLSAGI